MIRGRVLQIDLFMSHVHIPTDDHRFFILKLRYIIPEVVLPFHPVGKPLQLVLRVRHINGDEIILSHIQGNEPSLLVMFLYPHAQDHFLRFLPRKNGSSGIALPFCIVPILMITRKLYLQLSLLHFTLLNAEDIRIQLLKSIPKALVPAGADSVYIP